LRLIQNEKKCIESCRRPDVERRLIVYAFGKAKKQSCQRSPTEMRARWCPISAERNQTYLFIQCGRSPIYWTLLEEDGW